MTKSVKIVIPDFLIHYYENSADPFSNLSILSLEAAEQIWDDAPLKEYPGAYGYPA
jgi:hypothetical protein